MYPPERTQSATPGLATPPIALCAMCQPGRHSLVCLLESAAMPRAGRDAELPPLLPAPRRAARLAGRLRLQNDLPIVLAPSASDADFLAAARLRDAVRESCGAK